MIVFAGVVQAEETQDNVAMGGSDTAVGYKTEYNDSNTAVKTTLDIPAGGAVTYMVTQAAETPLVYGTLWGADSLGNLEIGYRQGRKISYRFRAQDSGEVDKILIYLVFRTNGGAWGKGYYWGDGGQVKLEIQSDDDSTQHLPSGITLPQGTVVDINPMAGTQVTHMFNFTDPGPVLEKGKLYHIVFSNPAPDPIYNYVSLDDIYMKRGKEPMQPAVNELDYAVLYIPGGTTSQSWQINLKHNPIYCMFYKDGTTQGQGYINAASSSGLVYLSGANKVRENFTVTGGDKTINKVGVFLAKIYGQNPGDLNIRLEQSNGNLIEEINIPSSELPAYYNPSNPNDFTCDWVSKNFLQNHTLINGNTYNLVLSAPAGDSYRIFPLDEGTGYGYRSGMFFDGYYQYNNGSGWQSRTNSDMQFYLAGTGGAPINQPPVLNSIGSKQIRKGSLLTFDVSATDPDGDALTYSTNILPDGATFNAQTFSWTPQVTGQSTVRFTVTDAGGLSDYEDVVITVTEPVNNPPVLNPIGNKQVTKGVNLTFNVSATDPDGDTLTYAAAGLPIDATFDIQTKTFSGTPQTAGQYTVQFSVTDPGGLSDSENVVTTVTEPAVNQPPVAVIKLDVSKGITPLTVNFDGSGSYDPDGKIVSGSWDFGDGTTSINPKPAHTFVNDTTFVKTFTVTTTVKDDKGATGSASVVITVDPVNVPPVLGPIGNKQIEKGKSLNFAVSATDPNGDVLTYSASGLPSGAAFNAQTFSWTPQITGQFAVRFTVTDTGGLSAYEDVVITVTEPVNLPPVSVIKVLTPSSGVSPLTVSFDGLSSYDPDGKIVGGTWDFGDGTTAIVPQPTHVFTNITTLTKVYTVTQTVKDDKGATGSATVLITVQPVNKPPVAVIKLNSPATGKSPLTVYFDGTNSYDTDGNIVSGLWNFGDGTTSTAQKPAHTFVNRDKFWVKQFTVKLTVKDNKGATSTASKVISVYR